MSLRNYPGRVLFASTLSSLVALVACGILAVYLFREQVWTAAVVSENLDSRMAAVNLEVILHDLVALHGKDSLVDPLLDRLAEQAKEARRLADKEAERKLVDVVEAELDGYQRRREAGTASPTELATYLTKRALPAVQALRNYNGDELRTSEDEHRQALWRMAWGLALVGGLASVGGLVLGYGLARGLQHTIRQLLVRVQGASDLLSQELPVAELRTGAEDLGAAEVAGLVGQVEQAVQKLQQQEAQVRRSERLAAVGQLAASMAHEIRNPLTAIKLMVQTTRCDPAAGGLSDEDLALIEDEIRRMERSLQTFLDFGRPPDIKRGPTDLLQVVGEALQLVRARAEQQQVRLVARVPDAPAMIDADGQQLRQVFVNLALNALDAMPHGGTLEVSIAPDARGGSGVDSPSCWVVEVRDSGPGIPASVLPRLFEPFASSKETGSGLGLVVSRRIVEEHGGTLDGRNHPAGGAVFAVVISEQ
jgi:two-component system sensor histidine kinase HydH